mmetsp:Transcript_32539/g.45139  ORF Transcript_32539/g.45139 Transcript_32539/m.45139 type:complete len:214 (+) Transcript_32539:1239-1880(+)
MTGSSVGAFSHAVDKRSSAVSSGRLREPQVVAAVCAASCIRSMAMEERAQGNTDSAAAHDLVGAGALPFFSKAMASSSVCTTKGKRVARSCNRAMNSGLPPNKMSVPRPAMLVEIVTAPLRPLCATISLSLSTFSGFAFNNSKGIPSLTRSPARNSERSTEVVPTKTGRPLLCMRFTSVQTAVHLASSDLKTTSGASSRALILFMGTTATERL